MSYDNPDLMRAVEKLQRQVDELSKQVKESNRPCSTENVIMAYGYVQLKNDMSEIKQMCIDISRRLPR